LLSSAFSIFGPIGSAFHGQPYFSKNP
jgi:hypothetical protein